MKLSTKREALLAQLQTTTRVASTRSAIQALSGVQLAASEGGVELRSTDMDVGIRVPLEAAVEREGTVVLPGRLLQDVARSLPNEDVTLELRSEQSDVEIVSGGAKFHLRTLRVEDFPTLPSPGGGQAAAVPAELFASTVQTVLPAASRDETRPILTSVLVAASGTSLRMVATDSYRLAVKETALESDVSGGFEVNVPARALQELARLASSGDELLVSASDNQVVFQLGGVTLSSRLIDGQFPNYRQLLPESYEHELRLASGELIDVVRRISLLAQKNTPLRLAFSTGELTVSAQTPDVGEASETIPVPFDGEQLEIGFNPDYLREGLESAGGEELVLKLISPLRPGLVEGAEGSGFLYLIMPIRLNV